VKFASAGRLSTGAGGDARKTTSEVNPRER
jgi:hypothetical protein